MLSTLSCRGDITECGGLFWWFSTLLCVIVSVCCILIVFTTLNWTYTTILEMFLLISTRAWLPILILVGARNPKLIYREPKSRLFQFPSWDLISKTTWCGSEWRETNTFSLPIDCCTISFHNKVPWGPPDGPWLWFSISADLYNLLQILPWMWLSNTRDKDVLTRQDILQSNNKL